MIVCSYVFATMATRYEKVNGLVDYAEATVGNRYAYLIGWFMNRAGGSAAFGRWAQKNIKTRAGAQLATIVLGILIFIDDYFNCLTVGSVMRPVTDSHQVSRAKLAYLIDATAAPVCIIAPISSWAAAVSGFVDDGSGLALFIRAIPYNYYALLTIVMMVGLVVMKADFGPMNTVTNGACPLVVSSVTT